MGSKKSKRKSKSKKSSKSKIYKKKKHLRGKKNKKSGGDSSENVDKNLDSFSSIEEYFSQIQNFSRVREDYFKYLQAVVTDNCALFGYEVTKETLECFALELEKDVLLACLQIDIYKKFMSKIISDIEKCTKAEQIHEEVKKLLLGSTQEETSLPKTDLQESESYFMIPTISSIRNDENRSFNECKWAEESLYSSEMCYPLSNCYPEMYKENYNNGEIEPWNSEVDQFWNNKVCTNMGNIKPVVESEQVEISDPLLVSRNQLQKSVEETLKQSEEVNKQKKDEKERAYIAQILEGDDSLDDRLNDSLSDNDNESKENIDESNLMDRLEKMREIFGVDSNDDTMTVEEEKEKPKKAMQGRVRRSNLWKHERVIQQYKYALIASEMTFEKREQNRKIFEELFGVDSDEEQEIEYNSEEKYRTNCVERISSWVVKYLMPFYQGKKIIGRDIFKALGHHISNAIIDEIQYPDEWTVKYFVSKFFPSKKKYVCNADILTFQLD